MFLVIDIGNTRTKWALAGDDGKLAPMQICLNVAIASAKFPVKQAQKVIISNVAGDAIAQQMVQLLAPLAPHFMKVIEQAGGVINRYEPTLGADRWAALVGAWHITKHATVVVNAGTAITIDALNGKGEFLGGTIMPGLYLMYESLNRHALQVNIHAASGAVSMINFPTNTQDAVTAGCLNAVAGAIHLMLKRLEKESGWLPKLVISGGDAHKIAQALNLNVKQVIITDNLVLQGLVLLAKE